MHRQHINDEHETFDFKTAFDHLNNSMLRVDCTDIKCRLCFVPLGNIKAIVEHLQYTHDLDVCAEADVELLPNKYDGGRLLCGYCDINFPGLRQMTKHVVDHYKAFVCELCGKSFLTKPGLLVHMTYRHTLKGYPCVRCKQEFDTLDARKEHVQNSKRCYEYGCRECKTRFRTKRLRQDHLVSAHSLPVRTFPCTECEQVFSTSNRFYVHFKLHHSKVVFECKECGMKCYTQTRLEDHMASHTKDRTYKCLVQARKNALAVVKHTTAFPFRVRGKLMMCVYCSDTFEKPKLYRLHMNEKHTKFVAQNAFLHSKNNVNYVKVDATDLRCRKCHLPFGTLKDAAQHIYKKHDSKVDLNADVGLQPFCFDEDKWACFICKEICSQFTTLLKHMPSHYKNYFCEVCGKSYITVGSLKYHVTYSHSKDLVCKRCKKTFPDQKSRTLHLRTSEKCFPFVCTECGERFLSWTVKKIHQNVKHGMPKIKLTCPCGSSFPNRKAFTKHFKTHANEEDFKSQATVKQEYVE
ncbi:unnamed protein product [Plutella xylostella]|uniref:(diamondback moth) hypothetical protein n=1 Tax=Plutella xylostella TaxID=51655 RepID=A0A8S4DWF2_PLUXY|nr:unnamed protein product [Plutella xylostella]